MTRTPPRAIALLFLVALLGVLAALGVVAYELAGWVGAGVWGAAAVLLLAAGATRARAATATPKATTCRCCDGDHTAPARTA
jgi:hypothetical protein